MMGRTHARAKTAPRSVVAQLRGNQATLLSRFTAKCGPKDPITGCVEWTGSANENGYGQIDKVGAHRVAYWLATGEDPGEMYVLHSCDNPPCVAAKHLRLGTAVENIADMYARGRQNNPIKVTDEQVAQIRALWAEGLEQHEIAARFGVSQAAVSRFTLGTHRSSVAVLADWQSSGFRTRNTVLSDDDVTEIRTRYARGGVSQYRLADEYGVGQPHISYLVRGLERKVVA